MRLNAKDAICKKYASTILQIGNGEYPTSEMNGNTDMIRVPNEWLSDADNLNDFIDETY
eukprot:CAMPEP_0202704102 /NCGR_PEP_ID=MMETSP1385-20130828/16853_1 /ASSEMBLY_ACC=CAM_ASM_000861 /TAXON_ID=933848 /ORGANISM="Elphidium margaritaceum" /LENGTH=58 /DNA_ID=CAMNT_0049362055 /DNA_START=212 /DNA_END=385 /DNA_ORIENTATION=+